MSMHRVRRPPVLPAADSRQRALACAIGARLVASRTRPLHLPPAAIFLHTFQHLALGAGIVRCSKRWPAELNCASHSALPQVQMTAPES